MPHKYNADRRHRIPRTRYKVTNWQAYEAGLRQRGSPTIWFTEEAIATWQAAPWTTPGGQARYSDLAIETSLILRTVFHQPLRQTEGAGGPEPWRWLPKSERRVGRCTCWSTAPG
jgi:hypothetical protein